MSWWTDWRYDEPDKWLGEEPKSTASPTICMQYKECTATSTNFVLSCDNKSSKFSIKSKEIRAYDTYRGLTTSMEEAEDMAHKILQIVTRLGDDK